DCGIDSDRAAAYKVGMLSTAEPEAMPRPANSLVTQWLTHLERRSLPHFNQLVIWVLLATGAILGCWVFEIHEGPRQGTATFLFWLPHAILSSLWLNWLFRGLLFAGIGLWLFQKGLPWSCWLVVVGFTGVWSLHVENTHNAAHIFHMANTLLVIQAIWITADAPLIKRALADGTYWTTPLVPRWVSLASIAYIGLFHTAAGVSKLWFSGPEWASGTSLQIWTYLWGRRASPTTQMILASRTFTQVLQAATLVVETAGVLAIIPRLRLWIGLGLLAFYVGVLATFDYGFQFNALLTAMYLLPLEPWLTRRVENKLSKNEPKNTSRN
ncbi:MAG TPA: hypothetical protein VFV87_08680, partial [Pirellulaceae bacterium]|nr:hypothetical protein [Pirellulaceae bacterium]